MSVTTLIGIVAGALTTISFAPQVVKSWRTRHTKDVSIGMFSLMCVGVALWLVYGILLRDLPIILANAVTLCLAASILALKIRFG
jgi:MtN3 and saliva related transmembrane protein